MISIYVDGSCRPNPGPGGWSVIVVQPDGRATSHWGYDEQTSNNRMELTAALEALQLVGEKPATIYLDSEYVRRGITEWIKKWLHNGWKTADKKPVVNQDLWRELHRHTQGKTNINWSWVKGHSGNQWNERADQLAAAARDERQFGSRNESA